MSAASDTPDPLFCVSPFFEIVAPPLELGVDKQRGQVAGENVTSRSLTMPFPSM